MAPRLIFRQSIGASDNIPSWNRLKTPGFFTVNEWAEQQGIDISYTEQISVTEYDDGTLVAYLVKRDRLPEQDQVEGRAKIRVYPDGSSRCHVEHFTVTSISTLLDQFDVEVAVG